MESRTITVEVGGTPLRLAVAHRARGEDLLFFLHGLGCAKESFREAWEREDYGDFSLLGFDQPGFGDSERPRDFPHTIEAHARVAAAVLEAALAEHPRQPRVHVVAHSLGGAIGLLLPEARLSCLASFANLEGNLTGADCGVVSRRTIAVPFRDFEAEFFPALAREAIEMGEGRFFLDRADPRAFYRVAESLVPFSDSEEPLRRFLALPCRKIYFHGDENRGLPTIGRLGGIEVVEISGAGHFLMKDNPGEFYPRLGAFLGVPGSG